MEDAMLCPTARTNEAAARELRAGMRSADSGPRGQLADIPISFLVKPQGPLRSAYVRVRETPEPLAPRGGTLRRFTLTVVALVAAALMILPAAFASASAGHAAAYRANGKTSQNGRVKLLLASSGRRVQITTEFQVSCDSGASFSDSETLTGPSTP